MISTRRTNRRDFLRLAAGLSMSAPALSWLSCASGVEPGATVATELGRLDGIALGELLRRGEVTPLELVDDTLRRIEAVNARLGAVLPDLFDVERARTRARQLAEGTLPEGPLAGVPILLKNLISYRHATITSGSRLIARRIEQTGGPVDDDSHALVEALEAAGMIVTGITNTPEFGLTDTTEPVLHGPTRNPWNLELSPGGSSGGSGAAVAAGVVPIAHANDGGGSIRIPASHCGIFGLKPTRGREAGNTPDGEGAILAISNDLCVSRTVRDTAAFLAAVERRDHPTLPPVGYVTDPSDTPRRIGLVLETFQGTRPEPEVEAGLMATVELLEELGHRVEPIELDYDGEAFIDAFMGYWASGAAQIAESVPEMLGEGVAPEDVLEPWTLALAELATSRGVGPAVVTAMQVFRATSDAVDRAFASHDLLLSPTLRTPPFPIGAHDPTLPFEVSLPRVLDVVGYTPLHNAVGTPAMSVPLHWTEAGLPVGMQLAAARGAERTLLELAYQLEQARPWRDRYPPVSAV